MSVSGYRLQDPGFGVLGPGSRVSMSGAVVLYIAPIPSTEATLLSLNPKP